MSTFPANASLSNSQRDVLRRAIEADAGWPAYSETTGMTLFRSSSSQCIQICNKLGIDCAAALERAGFPWRGSLFGAAGAKGASYGSRMAAILAADPASQQPVANATADPDLARKVEALSRRADALALDLDKANKRIGELETIQPPRGLAISINGKPAVTLTGHTHPMLDELLQVASLRNTSGNRFNIWIAGPTGSGKTHAAKQVAEVLGYSFGFHGAMTSDFQLVGYVSQATGQYQSTQFVDKFTNGGVILLDEIDAGSNEALLCLNAALANGMISLPDGRIVERHPDCVVIGAANTFGEGPNATFVGRNKLDAAFLSRFPVKLHWTYDLKLEQAICGNLAWARVVQHARKVATDNGIKSVIDTRQAIDGAAMIEAGFTFKRTAELTFLAPLTEDQRLVMTSSIPEIC